MPNNLPPGLKVSKLKFWMSYVYPQLLASASSSYNEVLEVRLSQGRLRLDSGNSTYSYEDLYDTFYTPFKQLQISEKKLQSVLVLGVGLCSIPVMLQKNFGQQAKYVAVDIDKMVINLSRQFVLPDVLANIDFQEADAYDFVATDTRRYDLIAVDVFIDTNTPSKFRSSEFLLNLKTLLKPDGGILLYNTMMNHGHLNRVSNNFYRSTFKQVFADAYAIRTSGNRVLVYQNK